MALIENIDLLLGYKIGTIQEFYNFRHKKFTNNYDYYAINVTWIFFLLEKRKWANTAYHIFVSTNDYTSPVLPQKVLSHPCNNEYTSRYHVHFFYRTENR